MNKYIAVFSFLLLSTITFSAPQQMSGNVSGFIIEKLSNQPLEFANVIIRNTADSTYFQGTITGSKGEFTINKLPFGEYKLIYSFIGFDKVETPVFTISSTQTKVNLGKLYISGSSVNLDEVSVTAQKSTFVNSIDRKTFNVGQDLMSNTGSVSDLLQNVPSVQVDIEGNVSLRGSTNVMFLINGKPSALMGANRVAVLQQMPANTIEKIEIITNPSAKYKPDGTSGIINLVIKKNKSLGLNGLLSANIGNDNRENGNFSINYNPGKFNVFGSYSIRQDERIRLTDDYRKHYKLNTDTINYIHLISSDLSRPLSHIMQAGFEYKIDPNNTFGATGSYNYRSMIRQTNEASLWQGNDFLITKDYTRSSRTPEFEKDFEFSANYTHNFKKEGHELTVDYTMSDSKEEEDNHYTNIYRIPASIPTYDNTLMKQSEGESQFSIEYVNPLSEDITLEAGYILETAKSDADFYGEIYNPLTSLWEKDLVKSNQFTFKETIHVLYGTYEQEFEKFGFLGGLRVEQENLNANQITTDTLITNQYFKIYPSLHFTYNLNDMNQLQVNYSHRIRRPEGEEMNPFPEYSDPYNIFIGNPHLKPADVHSVELGYQYKEKSTTFLSTLYYRYTYNGMTDITNYINDTVKVTSPQNLTKNSSAGLELVLSTSIAKIASINLSTNAFYNTIDASGIGYSEKKSIVAWSANLSAGFNLSKSTLLQLTSSYTAERLTAQGKQLPSFVINTGFRQEFLKRKLSMIITVSDVLNRLKNTSVIDTPELYEKIIRTRSARIIYFGITYSFGKQKKSNIEYDNQL